MDVHGPSRSIGRGSWAAGKRLSVEAATEFVQGWIAGDCGPTHSLSHHTIEGVLCGPWQIGLGACRDCGWPLFEVFSRGHLSFGGSAPIWDRAVAQFDLEDSAALTDAENWPTEREWLDEQGIQSS